MKNTVSVIQVKKDEWKQVKNVFYQVWNDGILYDYDTELENSQTIYGIQLPPNDIVGVAVINSVNETTIQLHYLVVLDTWRRHGFASMLIENVIKDNKEKTIRLEVRETNCGAISLYKRFGFQVVKRDDTLFSKDQHGQTAGLMMEKRDGTSL